MLTLGLTLLWLVAGLAVAHALRVAGLAARVLFAGTLAFGGIVACVLVTGVAGALHRPVLATLSGVASGAVLTLAVTRLRGGVGAALAADVAGLRRALGELRRPELAVLAVVALIAWSWALAAVVYLPPRSVDDLCNHLTQMFEAIARGHFVLPALERFPWFAYPQNGDLLALWSSLLRGDITWADGPQLWTAPLAALAIVAIARDIGATCHSAMLAALVFLLMPLVLRQSTSAYSDVSLTAAYGAALWGALRYARHGETAPLLAAGIGSGLVAGMRYHFLFALLGLVPLVLLGMRHAPSRAAAWGRFAAAFLVPAVGLGGYWYVRNLVLLGNPFFPFPLAFGPLTIFPSALPPDDRLTASASLGRVILRYPPVVFAITLRDVGAAGIDGGFGPVFWGAVIPLALLQAGWAVWAALRRAAPSPLALQFLVALVPYLVFPGVFFEISGRYLLEPAIAGFALLAWSLTRIRRAAPASSRVGIGLGVVAAALATLTIADAGDLHARKQLMRFGPAARAARDGDPVSPWHFVTDAAYGVGRIAGAWDLIDMVSAPRDAPTRRLWVYGTGSFPAGFYGTQLQNRVWNFAAPDRPPAPDAFVYLFESPKAESIRYFGGPDYRWPEVVAHPELYDPVLIREAAVVVFRRELLAADADLRTRTAKALDAAYPEDAKTAALLTPRPDGGTIIAIGSPGPGLKALELRGELAAHVVLARREDAARVVELARAAGPVLAVAPAGRSGRIVGTMGGEYHLYEAAP